MSESNSNLKLWESVETTLLEYTKKVEQRGGYTAIDPAYQAKNATEVFGVFGTGWGFDSSELSTELVESTGMVIHKAVFFYILDGKKGSFPIHNAVSVWGDKARTRPDEDFAKKVETNTISKALAKLGFNADVFLGQFDDHNYVQELQNKQAIEKADDKNEEIAKQKAEHQEWLDTQCRVIYECVSMNGLKGVYESAIRKLKVRQDKEGILLVTKAKDERKDQLEAKEK